MGFYTLLHVNEKPACFGTHPYCAAVIGLVTVFETLPQSCSQSVYTVLMRSPSKEASKYKS